MNCFKFLAGDVKKNAQRASFKLIKITAKCSLELEYASIQKLIGRLFSQNQLKSVFYVELSSQFNHSRFQTVIEMENVMKASFISIFVGTSQNTQQCRKIIR